MLVLICVLGACGTAPPAPDDEDVSGRGSPSATSPSSPGRAGGAETSPAAGATPTEFATTAETASGCAFTEIMTSHLAHDDQAEILEDSPLGPTIAAVQAGAPLPKLPEEAATWAEPERHLESLTVAAWLSCPPLARSLIDEGAPPDGVLGVDRTPAMAAAAVTEWEVVEVLLDAGADPLREAPGEPGSSVLSKAAAFGAESVVQRILDEVDTAGDAAALSDSLFTATSTGRVESVELLLDTGIRPPVGALLVSAEVTSERRMFEAVIAAAEKADYSDVSATDRPAHLEMLCDELAAPDTADRYRPGDIDRIAQVLGEGLPC